MLQYSSSKDKIKAIDQIVRTLCAFYFEDVTKKELELINTIILYGGFSPGLRDFFTLNMTKSKEHYYQLIHTLSKKGILINKEYRNTKELHPYFVQLIEKINSDKSQDKYIILKIDI